MANRLDEIHDKCKSVEHFKKTIASLCKYARNAADNDQGTVINLTLANLKIVQDNIKAGLSDWCDSIEGKIDKIGSNQNKLLEATDNFRESANGLQVAATKVASASDKLASNATPYRDALVEGSGRATKDTVDGRVLIDTERKAKQILIVIKDFDTSMLDTDQLMEKANNIIVKIDDCDRPDLVKVEAVTRFSNGGTLFQLNSKEAVKWLREPGNEDTFLKKLAKDAYVRERVHSVLLRGVPIIFEPGNESHLREIEEANSLSKFAIVKARWIKPEGRRCRGQTHAHVTAVIATAEKANILIKEGLNMYGARIRPEKLKQEPIQCMKCRRWGHFAINCPEQEDTCGTCGEAHRTNLCRNSDKKYCVSCRVDAHTSWDRDCPEAIKRRKAYDEKHPENNLTFFPTEENWTLTSCPVRIPLEDRFPQRYAVNSLPIVSKKPNAKGKKQLSTKALTSKDAYGKEQSTINRYFSSSQPKGKGKETAQEQGELRDSDDYEDCFDNLENDDIERLIGSAST